MFGSFKILKEASLLIAFNTLPYYLGKNWNKYKNNIKHISIYK